MEPAVFDFFDILDAMTARYHEHFEELRKMPWKVFCIKWVRLIKWAAEERERHKDEEREREWAKLRDAHQHG